MELIFCINSSFDNVQNALNKRDAKRNLLQRQFVRADASIDSLISDEDDKLLNYQGRIEKIEERTRLLTQHTFRQIQKRRIKEAQKLSGLSIWQKILAFLGLGNDKIKKIKQTLQTLKEDEKALNNYFKENREKVRALKKHLNSYK